MRAGGTELTVLVWCGTSVKCRLYDSGRVDTDEVVWNGGELVMCILAARLACVGVNLLDVGGYRRTRKHWLSVIPHAMPVSVYRFGWGP